MAAAFHCKGCNKNFADGARGSGFLAIMAQGDERTLSWWWCEACGVYTRKEYVDRFHGDADVYFYGPFSKETGDADLERVAKCPSPDDKYCECETHRHFEAH
jgi:hypothetical protein